jgi:hypothetical protein
VALTIDARLTIYQAIRFAQNAARAGACAWALYNTPADASTRVAIEHVKSEAYFAWGFVWGAMNTDVDQKRTRYAFHTELAQRAALKALETTSEAVLDADPNHAESIEFVSRACMTNNDLIREECEDLRYRYIDELPMGLSEDYVRYGTLLPDEAGLKELYESFLLDINEKGFDIFEPPLGLQGAYQSAALEIKGDDAPQRIALMLASKAYEIE